MSSRTLGGTLIHSTNNTMDEREESLDYSHVNIIGGTVIITLAYIGSILFFLYGRGTRSNIIDLPTIDLPKLQGVWDSAAELIVAKLRQISV